MLRLGKLTLTIFAWYCFSVWTPIINQKTINLFGYPNTITLSNLIVTLAYAYIFLNIMKKATPIDEKWPKDRPESFEVFAKDLCPMGIIKTISLLSLIYSLMKIPVWYLQTVKAVAPLFTLIFSYVFMKTVETVSVYLTLIPIMLGVILCSMQQLELAWGSLIIASICVMADVIQNVYTKKLLATRQYNQWSLQVYATFVALVIQFFIWFIFEGYSLIFYGIDPSLTGDLNLKFFIIWFISCSCYYTQLMLAFSVMAEVTPLSYSILNIVKRIVAVLVAIQGGDQNLKEIHFVGIALAMIGASAYNILKTPELMQRLKNAFL
eukprot:TRINITY_DN4397_c0_g1_i1.p1 TRINITY_DN4397_c0_g1~~TRINITY_DN4397_c0_g1_i1.p1  ORF type:complete len:354 (+),score=36.24 TRINITY_DN4397_c0_g1_i1:99-1064(+)